MTETKIINKIKCPGCGYKKEIRRDICVEPDGTNLIYYRCKGCGYMWDKGEKMRIKTTDEIISNIYQKPKFKCLKCNVTDIVDIPRKSTWQCLGCGSLFKSPLVTYDEEKININKKWVSVEEIFMWAKENPEDTFEDFLAELDYDMYLKLDKGEL